MYLGGGALLLRYHLGGGGMVRCVLYSNFNFARGRESHRDLPVLTEQVLPVFLHFAQGDVFDGEREIPIRNKSGGFGWVYMDVIAGLVC